MSRPATQCITSSKRLYFMFFNPVFPAWPVKPYLYLRWGILAAVKGVSEINLCFLHGTWKWDNQQTLCLCMLLVVSFWHTIRSERYIILCHLWRLWYGTKRLTGSKQWWNHGKWFKIQANFSKGICSLIKTSGFWDWPLLLQTRGC